MTRIPAAGVCFVLIAMVAVFAIAEVADFTTVSAEIRRVDIDGSAAVKVRGFSLRAGLARIVLSDGILVPSTTVAGRAVEFVFIGEGRIELEPPDTIEAGQLELFTGSETLVEAFERAVFVIALDAASDALADRPSMSDAPVIADATELFDAWIDSPERKLLDIEARIFADALGDRLAAGFFSGYFEGTRLGRFLYIVDPWSFEQVTLGQFVPPDLSQKDENRVRKSIEKAQRKDKLIGLEVADLGTWDTWLSSSLLGPGGKASPGARGIEPNHYEIDATLSGKELDLVATARLDLRVVVDGLRAVALEMNSDLIPVGVADGDGRDLDWFRSQDELVVSLGTPAGVGDRLEIVIDYTGTPIEKVASGAWVQRDTTGWYPHAGTIDRATYTVTVTAPEKLDVVAPGEFEDFGSGGKGQKWRRWSLDRLSMGFSFVVGRYEKITGRSGEVVIDVAIDRIGRKADRELSEEILATAIDVMDYYGEIFGAFPLDRLQIVSSPRGYSQGLLGFVSLSTAAVIDWEGWGALLGIQDRRTVIAHELAHQWWGNMVGWRGYRDQWISEAVANYAALLWARNRLDEKGDDRLGWGPTANWQSELRRTTDDGRPIESLGPLVVGARLDSSISSSAYTAIVYKKGAVVLDMLSMYFRKEAFQEILADIVGVATDRVISTDDFLRGISHFGGTDLSWFSDRYIRGTGLPEIYYSTTIEALDDGRWAVVGTAEQQAPYHFQYRIVETAAGTLDVRRSAEVQTEVTDSVLVVPFQIGVAGEPEDGGGGRPLLSGRVMVAGASSPFRLEIGQTPEVFWLDRDNKVFGRFFATDRWPRRMTYYQGLDREAEGDIDGAREAYRQALAADVAEVPPGWEGFFRDIDVESEGDGLDARIRLALARLDLDAGELAAARTEFELAADLIKSRNRWLLEKDLLVVEGRLDLLSGDPRSAFKRLKKRVLGKRGVDSREVWALLAIAARQVDDAEVFEQAVERAEELGVDIGPLSRTDSGESSGEAPTR